MHQTQLPDCVIALSFGFRTAADGTARSGAVNRDLAGFVAAETSGLPCIAQHEIADILLANYKITPAHVIHASLGAYLDSRQVLIEARDYMQAHNLHAALIVVQRSHAYRTLSLCRRLGIAAELAHGLPYSWDVDSDQWWTRGPLRWWLREAVVLTHHRIKRWI